MLKLKENEITVRKMWCIHICSDYSITISWYHETWLLNSLSTCKFNILVHPSSISDKTKQSLWTNWKDTHNYTKISVLGGDKEECVVLNSTLLSYFQGSYCQIFIHIKLNTLTLNVEWVVYAYLSFPLIPFFHFYYVCPHLYSIQTL